MYFICGGRRVSRWLGEVTPAARLPSQATGSRTPTSLRWWWNGRAPSCARPARRPRR